MAEDDIFTIEQYFATVDCEKCPKNIDPDKCERYGCWQIGGKWPEDTDA